MNPDTVLILTYLFGALGITAGLLSLFPCLSRPTWWQIQWYRMVILKCDIKLWFLKRLLFLVLRASLEYARFKRRLFA
jgi:hypothetical protein